MVQSADHFERFEPHTLLKHAVLRAYVERWARILLVRPDSQQVKVRIVDACAGAGQDDAGNPGSPLISAVEAEKARTQLSETRGVPIEVQVVAIEKGAARFRRLKQTLSAFGDRHVALQGTLEEHVDGLARDFARVPTLFFIDPFGMEPLRARVVRSALAGARNEVLLLFADQAGLRHIGVAEALEEAGADQPELSLFGPEAIAPPRDPEPSEHLVLTADASERILDAAFDGPGWRAVLDLPRSKRRQALVDRYVELLHSMGATRVLSLPVVGQKNNLKYHLVHATRSSRGYEVMKDAVERGWNSGLVGTTAVELMRLGTACNTEALRQAVLDRFAGREVAWTGTTSGDSVKLFALRDTPAMPHQLEGLKRELGRYKLAGRQIVYRFPAKG